MTGRECPSGKSEGLQSNVNTSYRLILLHVNYNLTHYFVLVIVFWLRVQLFKTVLPKM